MPTETQRATLAQRLDRYVIADDVIIEDVTEDFSLFHLTGETSRTCLTTPTGAGRNVLASPAGILERPRRIMIACCNCSPPTILCRRGDNRAFADRAGNPALGPRTDRPDYPGGSQSCGRCDRLRERLLHRPGSHLANEDVRADEQATLWIGLARWSSSLARTCGFFTTGRERGRLDYQRDAERSVRQRNRARLT